MAQPTAVRDDTARGLALRTLLPIAALIPCLLRVAGFVITRSLRPIVWLAGELDARRADHVTPLPLADMPSELHPFIASINRLLVRVRLLMDQQRRFVADAAHELRTPITALSLQAENLEAVHLSAEARNRVAALKLGMQRTRHLLEQLLTLARQEAMPADRAKMALTSLDSAVKAVVADLLPRARGRGIDLGFDLVEPLCVRAEQPVLAAIIRNLLDNALRRHCAASNNAARNALSRREKNRVWMGSRERPLRHTSFVARSSPMMKRMLGFCSCWAEAGMLAIVVTVHSTTRAAQIVLRRRSMKIIFRAIGRTPLAT